jgi:hypothetical protein
MRNVLDKSCRENQNTYLMFNYFFFPKSRRLGYDVEEMATDDNIIGASALHAG